MLNIKIEGWLNWLVFLDLKYMRKLFILFLH
jgi:hypothetical protein